MRTFDEPTLRKSCPRCQSHSMYRSTDKDYSCADCGEVYYYMTAKNLWHSQLTVVLIPGRCKGTVIA